MKLIRIISVFLTIIFFSINLYSRDINSPEKSRLLIHNFSTSDNYENVKKSEKNYQYYTIVMPEAISKTLGKSGNYQIRREKDALSIQTDFNNNDEKTKYTKKIKDIGLNSKSDYLITGNFTVDDKKLIIRIIIFDVQGREIEVIDHESNELGVQLQETIDDISQLVLEKIEKLNKRNLEKSKTSPFTALYAPFSIMTMGVDSGYLFFLGNWRSLYNNTVYISPFIDFDLSKSFKLSLKFTSIQSDTEKKDANTYSQMRILSSSMSLCYLLRFTENFGIAFSAGGGATKTYITIEPDKPFSDPMSEKKSIDPNIDISSYFAYNSTSFTLRTGINYKRIFYKNNPMDSTAIFAGAGIHF